MVFEITKPDLTSETRDGLPGSFVELPSGVTHFQLLGEADAPCVVLVHGNAAPYVSWDHTVDDLIDAGLQVLRYDVVGHGFSDRPRMRSYNRALYIQQLTDLIETLGIRYPISVVGTSQGGSIGACFAAEYPGKVNRLALLAPLFDDFAGANSPMMKALSTRFVGELVLQLAPDSKFSDLTGRIAAPDKKATLEAEVAKQLQFRGKRRAILANARGDSFTEPTAAYVDVKALGIPMLLIWGTEDKVLPEDSMKRLRDLIPDIEYHEIDGASHLAHYEFPERVNPTLTEFLTRPAAEEAPIRAAG
jgi:pimeloyl-ACP methyl ester carboxylesterase